MPLRQKLYPKDDLKIMIKEEFDKIINEIYDMPIKTDYNIYNEEDIDNNDIEVYRFKTDSGNSYDLDFLSEYFNTNRVYLENKEPLINSLKNADILLSYIEIGFTVTEVKSLDVDPNIIGTLEVDHNLLLQILYHVDPNIIGTLDDPYIKRTDRNEQYELLNRISYLIQEFIKNNSDINAFLIGKNTFENNLNLYIYIFNKIFSSNFQMFDIHSKILYKNGAFIFINKSILK